MLVRHPDLTLSLDQSLAKKRIVKDDLTGQLSMRELCRHFLGATKKCISPPNKFDPSKHILILNCIACPIELLIMDPEELCGTFPIRRQDVTSYMDVVQKYKGRIFLFVECRGMLADPVFNSEYVNLGEIRTGVYPSLPYGRRRELPRADFKIGSDFKPFEVEMDFVDYILSFCGSTFEDYWTSDIDNIIIEHRADPWIPLKI